MATSSPDATYDEQKRFNQEQKARIREISESLYAGVRKYEKKEEPLSARVGTIEHLNQTYWARREAIENYTNQRCGASCSCHKVKQFSQEVKGVEGDIEEAFVLGSNDCAEGSSDVRNANDREGSILCVEESGEQFRASVPNDS